MQVSLSEFVLPMGAQNSQLGQFNLTEMQIALEISAKGRVSVLGSGGEAGGKGGITLKLTK